MKRTDLFQQLTKNSSFSKVLLLLVVNLIGMGIIFILPNNTSFIKLKIQGFYNTKLRLGNNLDSNARYNLVYAKESAIIDLLDSVMQKDDIFLLPPQYYLVENAYKTSPATDPYTWTYPSKFKNLVMNKFHFIEITAPDSLLKKATHTFLANKQKSIQLIGLKDYPTTQKEALINHLKTYQPFGFFIPQTAVDYLKHKKTKQWKQ